MLTGKVLISQVISEMQTIEGKWYIEITNPDGLSFNKMSLAVKDSAKIAEVKQSVVDSLQKKDALVVISTDSLNEEWHELSDHSFIYCITDDTLTHKNKGMKYFSPQPMDNFDEVWQYCMPLEGESIARIDSTGVECMPQYLGRSIPSLGTHNVWQNSFSTVKGQFSEDASYFHEQDSLGFNFMESDFFAKSTNCSNSIYIDKKGNFTAITYPSGCIDRGFFSNHYFYEISFIGAPCPSNMMLATPLNDKYPMNLRPGENNVVFSVECLLSINGIKAQAKLKCSPNPAKEKITVEYSIPQEANWKECSIMLSNQQGEALLQKRLENQEGKQTISLPPSLEKGIYYCSLMYKGQVLKTEKIVIQ